MSQILALSAAREHLRAGDEISDEDLAGYIAAAEAAISDFLGRPLIDAEKGWADAESVPANVVHAIKVCLAALYDGRAIAPDELLILIGRYVVVSFG
ncbi:MAG: head-tail connector protein [Allosphingosinicella sp.]